MTRRQRMLRDFVFAGTISAVSVLAHAQASRRPPALILEAGEGDAVGSHHIKADPESGSARLGVGLQHVSNGQGIPLHVHEKEDEVLFVHAGSGIGAVGDERKPVGAGTTLFVPQGTWHGVEARSDQMEILWVVSPPYFAQNLRARAASLSTRRPSRDAGAIARDHGIRDTPAFFLPRLVAVSGVLAAVGAAIAGFARLHPLRALVFYAGGATLATAATIVAIGPGHLPPMLVAVATFVVGVAVFAAAGLAAGTRSLARRGFGSSARR